jgi:hypothetical protein
MAREYSINADFDISLRSGSVGDRSAAQSRQAEELPFHLLLLAEGGDSIVLPTALDDELVRHLERAGLPRPLVTMAPTVRREATMVPFGWNDEAVTRSAAYDRPPEHPPLEVVRRVNGRTFAAELERRLGPEEHVLGICRSLEEVRRCCASGTGDSYEKIVKAEYGNAGLGNRRIRGSQLNDQDVRVVARLLTENTRVVVERFRRRLADLSITFELSRNGSLEDLSLQEIVNTADGAFIGVVLDSESLEVERWRDELMQAASTVAERLSREGYFGAVGCDAFVWDSGGERRLRLLCDLNARLCMSAPAIRVWRRWGGDRVIYWRLFSSAKLRLPDSITELASALGGDSFDPASRCGVLLTSPLAIGGRRPLRFGVLLAGRDRDEVEGLDRRFRKAFER